MNGSGVRRAFWVGGIVAGALLIVLGGIWIWQGAAARGEVGDTISRERITGTPDMSPATFEGAPIEGVALPTCDVADEPIDTGGEARCFSEWMRVHALEGTGGRTFSEMGRFVDPDGKEVNSAASAAKDANGRPVANPARNVWINQRALATGLELAFVGERVSLFSIATGSLFAVIGVGLIVMLTAGGVLGPPKPPV